MDLIDSKYIGLVSSRLPKFKKIKANLYNFRCPVCGDSQKHKNKARGYLYGIKLSYYLSGEWREQEEVFKFRVEEQQT